MRVRFWLSRPPALRSLLDLRSLGGGGWRSSVNHLTSKDSRAGANNGSGLQGGLTEPYYSTYLTKLTNNINNVILLAEDQVIENG